MWNEVKERWKERSWIRRYLCLVLIAILVTTQCTQSMGGNLVIAQTSCTSHKQHTEDCGYKETRTAHPCAHTCEDGTCSYQEAVSGQLCNHTCDENCVKDENGLCSHKCEDETCSYQEAVPEQLCNHICDDSCSYVEIEIVSACTHSCDECDPKVIDEITEDEDDEVSDETTEGEDDAIIDETIENEEEFIDENMSQETEDEESVESTQKCEQHIHDDTCGYKEGDESAVCNHSCLVCNPAGDLNPTEAEFDKNIESEDYKDIEVTFRKGADTLSAVEKKIEIETEEETENKAEREVIDYTLSEDGETVILKKETLEKLDEGNHTLYFMMESGVEKSFLLTVTNLRQVEEETFATFTMQESETGSVEINETTFPDEIFRNYVKENFANGDDILTVEEIEDVTRIELGTPIGSDEPTERHGFKDLTGVKYFSNLEYLQVRYGQLTSLDVSGLTNLEEIYCRNNDLVSLDVKDCTSLATLYCDNNSITSLQVSDGASFSNFDASGQTINNLAMYPDASGNWVNEAKNSKDVVRKFNTGTIFTEKSGDTEGLSYFDISNAGVLTVKLEALTSGTVYFKSKLLEDKSYTLSGTVNYVATDLIIPDGRIEVNAAKDLDGDDEELITGGYIQVTGLPVSYTVECRDFEDKVKAGIPGEYTVSISYGDTTKITRETMIEVVVQIANSNNFEDEEFQAHVSNYDTDKDGFLTAEELKAVTKIDLGGTEQKRHNCMSLKGIEYFINLQELYCNYGALTSLDLSKNTALTRLSCDNNRLTELDITGLPLNSFSASDQTIGTLSLYQDATGNEWVNEKRKSTDLVRWFMLNGTAFYSADTMTETDKLGDFNVDPTSKVLTAETVVPMIEKVYFKTELNAEKGWNLTGSFAYNLPEQISVSIGYIDVNEAKKLFEKASTVNELIKYFDLSDLTVNAGESYTIDCPDFDKVKEGILGQYHVTIKWGNYLCNTVLEVGIQIDYTDSAGKFKNFPDQVFRTYVLENCDTGEVKDGFLTLEELNAVTSIELGTPVGTYDPAERNGFKDLTGVKYFQNLENLQVRYGQLTSLDVSGLKKLEYIRCRDNDLTSLNINGCTSLYELTCGNNDLTSLDVRGCTSLGYLDCTNNSITSLYLSESASIDRFLASGQIIHNLAMYPDGDGNWINEAKNSRDVVREFNTGMYYFKTSSAATEKLAYFDLSDAGVLNAKDEAPTSGTFYFGSQLLENKSYTLSGTFNYVASGLMVSDGRIEVNDAKALEGDEEELITRGYIEVSGNENANYTIECVELEDKVKEGIPGRYTVTIKDGEITRESMIEVVVQIANSNNFEDEEFQTHVSNYDTDEDGFLTEEELNAVTRIDLNGTEQKRHRCTSLKGIEYFVNLEELYCNYGGLTGLDLSKNTTLTRLSCDNNRLTELDITGLPLNSFSASGQTIGTLSLYQDATGNKWINEKRNSTDLVRKFMLIGTVFYSTETMTETDRLEDFNVDPTIKVLTTEAVVPMIEKVYFKTELNTEKDWNLTGSFTYNLPEQISASIGYIDVNDTKKLSTTNDLIKYFDLSGLTVNADASYTIDCPDFDEVKAGTIGQYKVTIKSGDYACSTILEVGVRIDYVAYSDRIGKFINFPDQVFRTYVSENCDTGEVKDGFLTFEELNAVTRIELGTPVGSNAPTERNGFKDLTGVKYFQNLENLQVRYGQLTSLDVSGLTALEYIHCRDNNLTSLNVSGCTSLYDLTCGNNSLTSLDVSDSPLLWRIECQNNSLKSLDVSGHTSIDYLNCSDNNLTSLVVSGCTSLKRLYCYNNQLTELDITGLPLLSVDAYGQTIGTLSLYQDAIGNKWVNEKQNSTDLVRKFMLNRTTFYSAGTMIAANELENFSVDPASKVLIVETVVPLIEKVYFKSELNAEKGWNLTGSFAYNLPEQISASIGYIDVNDAKNLSTANDLIGCFVLSGSNVNQDASYTIDCPGFDKVKAGTLGQYHVTIKSGNYVCNTVLEVGVQIDYTHSTGKFINFPDEIFRTYVSQNCDTGEDKIGFLTLEELNAVTSIELGTPIESSDPTERNGFKDLTGVKYFRNLESLQVRFGQLTSLDVSGLMKLEIIYCRDNDMTSLNVSGCMSLETLYTTNNPYLTNLDVSGCTSLTTLECQNSGLRSLDVSDCTTLTILYCQNNSLTKLDTSANLWLTRLWCQYNELTELKVANTTALVELYCSNNQLTELDISGCKSLVRLTCLNNQLTELDVSNLKSLTRIECQNNQLTELDITGLPLTYFDASGQNIGTLSLYQDAADKKWVNQKQNSTDLVRKFVLNGTAFYRAAAMIEANKLEDFNVDPTSKVLTAETVVPMIGKVYFKTELNAEKGWNLTGSFAYNLPKQISASIGYIDVNDAKNLSTTNSTANDLIGCFDLSGSTVIGGGSYTVDCPDFDKVKQGILGQYHVTIKSGDYACSTVLEVGVEIEYIDNTDSSTGEFKNFPNQVFRTYVSNNYDTGEVKDGFLTLAELNDVERIDVSNQKISDLTGIEYFTKLDYLDCSGGELGKLDVSSNTSLTELYCYSNDLTELVLGENRQLRVLHCYSNAMTEELDVSNCSALMELHCYFNELEHLKVDGLNSLTELQCYSNNLTRLEVSRCKVLEVLWCSDNNLAHLNVWENTALKELLCDSNELEELDVSTLENLTSLSCDDNKLMRLDISKLTNLQIFDANVQRIFNMPMVYDHEATEWNWSYNPSLEAGDVERTFISGNTLFYENEVSEDPLDIYRVNSSGELEAEKVLEHESIYFETILSDGSEKEYSLNGTVTLNPSYFISANNRFYTAEEIAEASLSEAIDLKKLPDLLSITPNTEEFKATAITSMAEDYADEFDELQSGTVGTYGYQVALLNRIIYGQIQIVSEGTVVSDDHSAYIYAKNFYIGLTAAKSLTDEAALVRAATTYKNALGRTIEGSKITEFSNLFSVSEENLAAIQGGAETGGNYDLAITYVGEDKTDTTDDLTITIQVTVVNDAPESLVEIPAEIKLERLEGTSWAEAKSSVKLLTDVDKILETDVNVFAVSGSLILTADDAEDQIMVVVYDESGERYSTEVPLATLNAQTTEKKFSLKSSDVSKLQGTNYTGTMQFRIE